MIKKYQDFLRDKINENLNKDQLNKEEKDFLDKFDKVINYLRDEYYSFTRLVASHYHSIELGPAFVAGNLTWDEIKKHKDLIFSNIDDYCSINGGVDWLLYRLDSKYILGGFDDDLKSFSKYGDGGISELAIKYNYGYHLSTYGEAYLLQCFDSIDEYFETVISNAIFMCYFGEVGFDNYFSINSEDLIKVRDEITLVKKDRDWYLDLNKIYDVLMGYFKPSIDKYRGSDHIDKVFNIIRSLIDSFFEREIKEKLIETEEVEDYIKISYNG